ncbi:hypothetical protein GZH53_15700 [Flavihumibacter sp. R14]|nr:hypothetical protein [Flavihumibacter soli]
MKLLCILLVLTGLAANSYAAPIVNNKDTTGYVIVSKKPAKSPIGAHIKIKATLQSAPNTVPYGLVDKNGKLVFLASSSPNGKIDFHLWGGDFSVVRVSLVGYATVDIPLKDLYGYTVEINVNLMDTPINH